MARLPALVTEYARLDGRPRKTIDWYARLAREAGKLPTIKRGLGAAHMGVREAVNLILACNGAEDPKEGADAVDRFRSYTGDPNNFEALENDEMRKIGLQPTFGEALEELLRLTPQMFKTFDEALSEAKPKLSEVERLHEIKLVLCVELRKNSAMILLGDPGFYDHDWDLAVKNILDIDYRIQPIPNWTTNITAEPQNEQFNLRETVVYLRFGIFMGLADLLLENSMQLPDELIQQPKGGGGDG